MNIHEKLQTLLKKKGHGSQKELAGILGEDRAYLNKWVKGVKPVPPYCLLGTSHYLGVTVDYLLDDNQEIPLNKHIPLIGTASCGIPSDSFYGENTEYVSVSAEVNITSSYAVTADGDSMLPNIADGDLVICDTSKPPSDNRIVHYTYEGESGIKRIKRQDDGSLILLPDNREYTPTIVPKEKNNPDFLYIARCVQVTKNL